jgi:hypothetical protein
VPGYADVRVDYVAPCPVTRCAAVLLIESDGILMIGPKIAT